MLKGFKDFIMRGNIVDLAVAVVIGAAFAKVVDTMVSSIVNPVLAAAGNAQVGGMGIQLKDHPEGTPQDVINSTFINFGAIINALIVFLLTALVVYFVFVVPMNKVMDMRGKKDEAVAEPSEEVKLLTEIRDSLNRR